MYVFPNTSRLGWACMNMRTYPRYPFPKSLPSGKGLTFASLKFIYLCLYVSIIRHNREVYFAIILPNIVFSFENSYFCVSITNGYIMWQRIQTLYLGTATALIFSMFFCIFATIIGPDGAEVTIRYTEKMPYLVLMIMLITAHVAACASFKTFFLQARVSVIAGLLAIGFQAWIGLDILLNREGMSFSITALFPLVAAFLDFIAAKKSMVDEMTVQAVKSARKSRRNRK